MKTVFVAGATGYLGGHIVRRYLGLGWRVKALVRDAHRARGQGLAQGLGGAELIEAEATCPDSLAGVMAGVDLVVSTLGITRQRDGLTYWDVDFGANKNLLNEALSAGVPHFTYVHVLNAEKMLHVPLVAAKQKFAEALRAAPIRETIIAPSGFYSDMADFLNMAKHGRVWLFGSGALRLNPIDGADLARAISEAVAAGVAHADIGGPEILTHRDIAEKAFDALDRRVRITRLPEVFRRMLIYILPWVTPDHIHGPALFFLTAMGMDMVGDIHGTRTLDQHFADVLREDAPDLTPVRTGKTAGKTAGERTGQTTGETTGENCMRPNLFRTRRLGVAFGRRLGANPFARPWRCAYSNVQTKPDLAKEIGFVRSTHTGGQNRTSSGIPCWFGSRQLLWRASKGNGNGKSWCYDLRPWLSQPGRG